MQRVKRQALVGSKTEASGGATTSGARGCVYIYIKYICTYICVCMYIYFAAH